MLFLLGITFVAGALWVITRWWVARVDSLGRPRPRPTIALTSLLLVGTCLLTVWFLRVRLDNRLSEAAGALIGGSVTVHCQTFGEALGDLGAELGYVPFGPDGVPERKTLIKRDQCKDLAAYLRSDKTDPTYEHVVAVHTLTHEAIHMSGVVSEAATECLAVQRDAEMARLLGASTDSARQLARDYWTYVYPRMPEDYRSAQCGDDLALDAGFPDSPWDA